MQDSGFLCKISFPEVSQCKFYHLLRHFCPCFLLIVSPIIAPLKKQAAIGAQNIRNLCAICFPLSRDSGPARSRFHMPYVPTFRSRFRSSRDLHFRWEMHRIWIAILVALRVTLSIDVRSRFRFNDGRHCHSGHIKFRDVAGEAAITLPP
jgi:hypothetical protein